MLPCTKVERIKKTLRFTGLSIALLSLPSRSQQASLLLRATFRKQFPVPKYFYHEFLTEFEQNIQTVFEFLYRLPIAITTALREQE